jgi:hypothetical protein
MKTDLLILFWRLLSNYKVMILRILHLSFLKSTRVLLVTAVWLVGYVSVTAQSIKPFVLPTANSNINTTSNKLIWTVGEAVASTLQGPEVRLYQGFVMPIVSMPASQSALGKSDITLPELLPIVDDPRVLVYPNPVSQGDLLQIRTEGLSRESVGIKVVTSNGQVIETEKLGAEFDPEVGEIRLRISLTSGFYLLQIPTAHGIVTRKLLVR